MAARQRMVYGGHKYVWMGCKRFGTGGHFGGRAAHDGDVHLVGIQHFDQLFAVTHHQFDINALMFLVVAGQQMGQKVFGGADHADGEYAHFQLLQAGRSVLGIFQRGQHLARIDQHVFAHRGERHLAPAAVKQGHADVLFELAHLHGHGRWREVEGLRCSGKAQLACNLTKDPQLAESGVLH